jgi:hypothetical protein
VRELFGERRKPTLLLQRAILQNNRNSSTNRDNYISSVRDEGRAEWNLTFAYGNRSKRLLLNRYYSRFVEREDKKASCVYLLRPLTNQNNILCVFSNHFFDTHGCSNLHDCT